MSTEQREGALRSCLSGIMAGDAMGLPYEGLSAKRIQALTGGTLRHRFCLGRGMVSDDSDHAIFVVQAMQFHPEDVDRFARTLAWRLRCWLLCLPAGIGLATVRGILKLWAGVPPKRSGVFSAGNGPAMRSAPIGVFFANDAEKRRAYVEASTQLTHSDPKAIYGALAIAEIAAFLVRSNGQMPNLNELENLLRNIAPTDHWQALVDTTIKLCQAPTADKVSGYIYVTVPAVISEWYARRGDYKASLEALIQRGGDTDTSAAIAGGIAVLSTPSTAMPAEWLEGIRDWPHNPRYLDKLADGHRSHQGFHWGLALRSIPFIVLVLLHGFRRLLPPY